MSYDTLRTLSGSVTGIPTGPPTVVPPVRPPGQATGAPGAGAVTVSLDIGNPASNSLLSQVSGSLYNTLQTLSGSVTSTPTVPPTMRPPVIPGLSSSKGTTISGTALDLGQGGGSSSVVGSGLSLDILHTLSGSVTSTPTVPPTMRPPGIPGLSSDRVSAITGSALDFGQGGGSSDGVGGSDTSTSTIGLEATSVHSDSASSSSASYIDPGQYGASGTLTSDSNTFSGTVEPSGSSIIPNPSSVTGPPLSYVGGQAGSTDSQPQPFTTSVIKPIIPTHGHGATVTSLFSTLDMGATSTSSSASSAVTPYGNSTASGNATLSNLSYTASQTLTTDSRGSTGTLCGPTDALRPVTTYSIVYTSTITWYGNPALYTPPYPPLSTPAPCIPPSSPRRLTMSHCTATGAANISSCVSATLPLAYTTALPGITVVGPGTITFMTTDKNPAVVFTTINTPNYGVSPGTGHQVVHTSATPTTTPPVSSTQVPGNSGLSASSGSGGSSSSGGDGSGSGSGDAGSGGTTSGSGSGSSGGDSGSTGSGAGSGSGGGSADSGTTSGGGGGGGGDSDAGTGPAESPITIAVQPSAVVLDGQTVTDDPSQPTQTVTLGYQPVTIEPSQVIVAGQTVTRPAATGAVYVPTPTSTQIQGVPVTASSSIAVIGGTTFTLGLNPTTTIVGGEPVTLGPSGIVVASTTIPVVSIPEPTNVVVEGGELVTAIGPSVVVIQGTTITYGPDKLASTTVVDGDTITIAPSGVVVDGTTIGGPTVGQSITQYEIVGGATITQVGPSVVVINNATYTVGPGADSTTTVVSGQTVSIGPGGVAAGTHTLGYPFGPTTTITPRATAVIATASGTASATATATAAAKKDAGLALRPDSWGVVSFVCIAMAVVGYGV